VRSVRTAGRGAPKFCPEFAGEGRGDAGIRVESGVASAERALLAERAGVGAAATEANTFHGIAAPAQHMFACCGRGMCSVGANAPAIQRRCAALPRVGAFAGSWLAILDLGRRPLLGGKTIGGLFGAIAATGLDPLARQGAWRRWRLDRSVAR